MMFRTGTQLLSQILICGTRDNIQLFAAVMPLRIVAVLQEASSELLHMTIKLVYFSTYTKLFYCCNCSGVLNISNCNHLVHFETHCVKKA